MNTNMILSRFTINTVFYDQLTCSNGFLGIKKMEKIFVMYSINSQNTTFPVFEVWINKIKLENTFHKQQMNNVNKTAQVQRALGDTREDNGWGKVSCSLSEMLSPLVSGSSWFKSISLSGILFLTTWSFKTDMLWTEDIL